MRLLKACFFMFITEGFKTDNEISVLLDSEANLSISHASNGSDVVK